MNIKDLFKKKDDVEVIPMMPKEDDLEYQYYTFLDWYQKNIVPDTFGLLRIEDLISLIDKIAVWYEFKYSDEQIEKRFHNTYEYNNDLSNNLSNDMLINHLNKNEIKFLKSPRFESELRLGFSFNTKINLTKKGLIKSINCSGQTINKYNGMNIKQYYIMQDELTFNDNDEKTILRAIRRYDNAVEFKKNLMNIIMIRIMMRGDNIQSVYRAMMYAKDFDLDLKIPTRYGLGDNLYNICIINEYLKNCGSVDLEGYFNYFLYKGKSVEIKSISEILSNKNRPYTAEEIELQQRLVGILKNNIPELPKENEEEKVKRLRIERGLNRSRSRRANTKIETKNLNIVR